MFVTYDYRWHCVEECKYISTNFWQLPNGCQPSVSNLRPLASQSVWMIPGTWRD